MEFDGLLLIFKSVFGAFFTCFDIGVDLSLAAEYRKYAREYQQWEEVCINVYEQALI